MGATLSIFNKLYSNLTQKGFSNEQALSTIEVLFNELQREETAEEKFAEQQDRFQSSKENGFFLIEKKKMSNGGWKEIEVPDYEGLAEYLIDEKHLKCDDSMVYIWSGKHYKSISFLALKNIIKDLTKHNISPALVANFYQMSLIKSYFDFSSLKEVTGYLNCNNGLLNVKTGELIKHDSKKFIKYVLQHDYVEDAKCPTFLKSLRLVTNNDKGLQRLIRQVFGYCIAGGHPIAHKAFMFFGEGGNGKSTILTALSNLVGQDNTARVPLTLFDKPFSMISLDGKLVNLIDETPKFNINPEAFKNVVSGGYVRAAHKGKPEVDLKINARILFACNKMPNFKDDSDGMMRRLVIIPFNHKIDASKMDMKIDYKIKNEMSGILNWALIGLRDLIESDYHFHKCKATESAIEQFKEDTDPAYLFLKEHVVFSETDCFLTSNRIYESYKLYCQKNGYYSVSQRVFSLKSFKYFREIYAENGKKLTESHRIKHSIGRGIKHFVLSVTDF